MSFSTNSFIFNNRGLSIGKAKHHLNNPHLALNDTTDFQYICRFTITT